MTNAFNLSQLANNTNSSGQVTLTTGVTGTLPAGVCAAGTALLPALTPTGDLNTGVWFPAADTVAVSTAGAERMRIDASGNVGIGTASPYAKLDVVQATAGYGGWKYCLGANATDFPAIRLLATTGNTGNIIAHEAGNLVFLNGTTATAAGAERMRIDSNGNLLVGTTSSSFSPKLQISGSTVTYNLLCIQNTGTTYGSGQYLALFLNSTGGTAGSIQHTAVTTVAYATTSDNRLKENIVDADTVLDKISAVKVRAFDWKEDKLHSDYGFIAQELYKVFPDAVGKGDDAEDLTDPKGTWQVEYGRLTPMLLKAIQELKAIVDAQAVRIAALEV
jgi:hypothetical protein